MAAEDAPLVPLAPPAPEVTVRVEQAAPSRAEQVMKALAAAYPKQIGGAAFRKGDWAVELRGKWYYSASTCKLSIGRVGRGALRGAKDTLATVKYAPSMQTTVAIGGLFPPAEGVAEDRACAGCSEGETSPLFIFS
jgi:hypothetical protein